MRARTGADARRGVTAGNGARGNDARVSTTSKKEISTSRVSYGFLWKPCFVFFTPGKKLQERARMMGGEASWGSEKHVPGGC